MGFRFCSFASGSTGNCYLVRTEETVLLIDTGISGKRIVQSLDSLGLAPSDISAILITHEHSDHVMSIKTMARKADSADIYATEGTFASIDDKIPTEREVVVESDCPFTVGDIRIVPFDLSHDAVEPVGYTFSAGGKKLSLMTDTGYVSEDMYDHIKGSDALILEANHEVNVLRAGPYPYVLKQRILSEKGHLSNETCGNVIARLLDDREETEDDREIPYVMLAHVSRQNNTPDMAYMTVKDVLFDDGLLVDKDVRIGVAGHDQMTPEIEI